MIGSFNFDFYSWAGNNEIMLDVRNSNNLVNEFNKSFNMLLKSSKEINYDPQP